MHKLDEQEVKIIREIIRNPRSSDNAVSKKTKVPVMTVNRKRKSLEEKGLLKYYASIVHGEDGTNDFHAEQLYVIKLKIGITAQEFLTKIRDDKALQHFNSEHIMMSYLGEKDGHLALMMVVNAYNEQELTESFNGFIIPMLKKHFGDDCIISVETLRIIEPIRKHHNYIPGVNLEKGRIKEDWPDDYIFVDRESFHTSLKKKK